MPHGWRRLIPAPSRFRGEGNYPIDAYSEFMPPPRLGWKPYGDPPVDPELFSEQDQHGWRVSEFQEAIELQPGLLQIAKQVVGKIGRLVDGNPETGILRDDLIDNPYWPPELASEPKLPHERCLVLLPLALSRTQDDKGRVRWTLFGNSEQGPGKAFWRSFFTAPGTEVAAEQGLAFFRRLLHAVYREDVGDLRQAGFRILPDQEPLLDFWTEGPMPSWTEPFVLKERQPIKGVKYLLTFRPFSRIPAPIQCRLPGRPIAFAAVSRESRLLGCADRPPVASGIAAGIADPAAADCCPPSHAHGNSRAAVGLSARTDGGSAAPNSHAPHVRNTYKRTHRWDKVLRDQDELALIGREDKLLHVLFSTIPDDLMLYDKPMARNVQLWTEDGKLLLDGPSATLAQLKQAMRAVQVGGLFGYRFQFPATRVGAYEVYWHRPLVAFRNHAGECELVPNAPNGYLTAYNMDRFQINKPVELWPRIQERPLARAALALYSSDNGRVAIPIIRNVRKLFDAYQISGGKRLSRSFARQLLSLHRSESLEAWFDSLPDQELASQIRDLIEPAAAPLPRRKGAAVPDSLTYQRTAKRSFEVAYWKTIARLAEGPLLNKNNADCVRDEITQRMLPYHGRQLDIFGDHLLDCYRRAIKSARMTGKALAGEIPFRWRTDFDYSWMGGWLKNQEGDAERDMIVVIPGRDRKAPSSCPTITTPRTWRTRTKKVSAVAALVSPPAARTTTTPPPPR